MNVKECMKKVEDHRAVCRGASKKYKAVIDHYRKSDIVTLDDYTYRIPLIDNSTLVLGDDGWYTLGINHPGWTRVLTEEEISCLPDTCGDKFYFGCGPTAWCGAK